MEGIRNKSAETASVKHRIPWNLDTFLLLWCATSFPLLLLIISAKKKSPWSLISHQTLSDLLSHQ